MRYLGSARVSRAGDRVLAIANFFVISRAPDVVMLTEKFVIGEDAIASTRDACAPQSFCDHG